MENDTKPQNTININPKVHINEYTDVHEKKKR